MCAKCSQHCLQAIRGLCIFYAHQSPSSSNSRSNSPTSSKAGNASPTQVSTKAAVAEPMLVSRSAIISGAPEYYNPEDANSDTEDEGSSVKGSQVRDSNEVLVPDAELKKIVDKLVVYVAKNGRDFEIIVKRKCDPRFSFLEPGDPHNAYYERELNKLLTPESTPAPSDGNSEGDSSQKQSLLRFSIKKPRLKDKSLPAPDTKVKSALEESSDEESSDQPGATCSGPPTPPPPPQIIPPPPVISDLRKSEEVPSGEGKLGTETAKIGLESAKTGSDTVKIASDGVKIGSEAEKSVEALKAGGESDEKQRERKRRAEMFLKMLQRTGSADLVVGGSSVKKTAKDSGPVESNGNTDITVININSDDSDSGNQCNGHVGPLDLKAKLKALRTRSKSPGHLPKPSLDTAPPPPKIRKLKSSHHHRHHKHKSDKARHRSRSDSATSSDLSRYSKSPDRKSHRKKKSHRKDPSRSPSPKRSRHKKTSKVAKKHTKKRRKRDSVSPHHRSSKSRHRRESHSRSRSPERSKSHKSKKRKRRTRSRSSRSESSSSSD
ncbi:hypothetical protein M8J75_012143 [Diaphorina citri]|nr:hypothetical protein M8J75_012143 [Diaphorina citri]